MITYVMGDIFESPARVLVNTVNTVGVMGKGIAKQYKEIYPEMFKQYQYLCEKQLFAMGQLWLYKTQNKWVLSFPTKQHWRQPSKLEYIEAGLKKFVATYSEKGITSIAFPALGCGNGDLNWEQQVQPLMEAYLKNLPIDVYIYLYNNSVGVEHKRIDEIKEWLRSEPQSLPFDEVWEDIEELLSRKNNFETMDGKDSFIADICRDEQQGICISSQDNVIRVYHDQMLDLWQHIRSLGFCMVTSMPNELDEFAVYIMAILKELPYLKPVIIAPRYQELPNKPLGLQYLPPLGSNDGLFELRNIHGVNPQ